MAVLSILLTAPLGAIGIIYLGEKILDHGDRSLYRFKELREKLGLPRTGERLRSKEFGTVWKVIGEKEIWLRDAGSSRAVPTIRLKLWKEESGTALGTGKTMTRNYTQGDTSFERQWEILYDW